MKNKVVIIGAGMAGIAAARLLTQQGYDVCVLEKSRGVGGRMSTRRLGATKADHGAQYFSVKSLAFQKVMDELVAKGIATTWQVAQRKYPRYIGSQGMNTIPKAMAEGITIFYEEKAVKITFNEVQTESGGHYQYDYLVLTIPVPQALQLLSDSQISIDTHDNITLQDIQYDPCFAVLVTLKQPIASLKGGLIQENQPVAWVVDNAEKGITTTSTLTLHASDWYSKQNLERAVDEVGLELIGSISSLIKPEYIQHIQTHRWRYSLVSQRSSLSYLWLTGYPIIIGGDGFGVGNVEGAFLSGEAIAQAINS
ncbi:NAD(P)/FAD-dependent oxidoreductase [Flectobacillus major]|uniref:NAD(P)/FAD-dependent oxidoreductase n=1 Tax=Flectobacillus major TaxID=103 RepID=UPI00042A8DA9|nr:FAD-dependent oxidoreductase [Flectobacillus major]